MKISVLGSGTCGSNLPGIPSRYPPGFLVEAETEKILLECSEGIRFRLEQAGHDFAALSHIAISHSHADHFVPSPFLQAVFCTRNWTNRPADTPINFYVPDYIAANFVSYWGLHLPGVQEKDFHWAKLNFRPLSKGGQIDVGKISLEAFPVYHSFGEIEALAFRLESDGKVFAYSGYTGMCDGILKASREADLFICEASARVGNKTSATGYGHLSPNDAGIIAKQSKVKKLVLTHYTGLDSDEAMIRDCRASGFSGEIVIAKDFQVFEI